MSSCSPRDDTWQDNQIWHICKYSKSLKYQKRGFDGFDQYFEHDRVLKLLYMDNICKMSFPKFSQIFLKH